MKTSIRHLLIATILLLGSSIQASLGKELFSAKVIEKAKKAVVTIHGSASLKAYDDKSNAWSGTGFIIDKHQGHVLTNAHIVGRAVIGTYHLFFYDGTRADAKLLYYDPWLDYAFLQVDPTTIPHGATEIKFSSKDPVMDQPVFIIGNNEGKSFSTHTGTVTGLYEIAGNLPQHSIRLSLNTRGGSSGSPVMNQQGEAIALHYGGSDTFGIGLHAAYIRYVLGFIAKGKSPIRKHIGVITEIYSLNEAAKYRDFPNDKIQAYNKKFPLSLGNAIQVSRTLPGSPAEGRLMAGDIIWAVNGQEIGPSLVELDLAMNMAEKDSVRLTIFRDGQWQEVDMLLYNLEDHKITQMVSFGGALFFEADDFFSDKTGMPAKTLTFAIAQSSATFNQDRKSVV